MNLIIKLEGWLEIRLEISVSLHYLTTVGQIHGLMTSSVWLLWTAFLEDHSRFLAFSRWSNFCCPSIPVDIEECNNIYCISLFLSDTYRIQYIHVYIIPIQYNIFIHYILTNIFVLTFQFERKSFCLLQFQIT